MPPDAPSTWIGMSRPVSAWIRSSAFGDLGDRLVHAGVGHAHDRDDADGVLVDVLLELEAVEHLVLLGDRHVARLDVPVVAELLPAHLHRAGEDEVGLLGRLARRAPCQLPAALERQPAEHARLGRPDRRGADRLPRRPASSTATAIIFQQRVSIAAVCGYSSLSTMFLSAVSEYSSVGVRVHPRPDERREVQPRVAVEHRLVVDDLVRGLGERLPRWEDVQREVGRLARAGEQRVELVLIAEAVESGPCVLVLGHGSHARPRASAPVTDPALRRRRASMLVAWPFPGYSDCDARRGASRSDRCSSSSARSRAYADAVGPVADAATFFVGALFFTTAGRHPARAERQEAAAARHRPPESSSTGGPPPSSSSGPCSSTSARRKRW